MKVLLVIPRYGREREFHQIPLGLGYIAAAIKKAGFEVVGLNLNYSHGNVEGLVRAKVHAEDPDICASGSIAPYYYVLKDIFAAAKKTKPSIINIAGGGMVSGEPEISICSLDIDVGVVGEGEYTIVELLNCLENSGDLGSVNGIVYRDQGKAIETMPRSQYRDLDKICWPDYDFLDCDKNISNQLVLDNYFFHTQPDSKPRCIDMISSRSCPFSCTFCFHPVGKRYRERPLDDFFAELDMVVDRYNINMVALIDELFSLKRSRLLEFCERIKRYGIQWIVQLHVSSVDDETLGAMYDSGCSYISYGIESMSLPILRSMKKKTTPQQIEDALALTYRYKIGIQGNLLFGDKEETIETANESMHWWANNRQYQIYLAPLIVYPGSPDYFVALEEGLIKDRWEYVQDLSFNLNISRINDAGNEMIKFMIWIFNTTLLRLAPIIKFELTDHQIQDRGKAYDIVWTCPSCGFDNVYKDVVLSQDDSASHNLRLACRECRTRWDIVNKARSTGSLDEKSSTTVFTRFFDAGQERIRSIVRRMKLKCSLGLVSRYLSRSFCFKIFCWIIHSVTNTIKVPDVLVYNVGARLQNNPFLPDNHVEFAEVLISIGAYGAARLHYLQALALDVENKKAKAGLGFIDGPALTDEQRKTYFISWSESDVNIR